MMNNERCYIDFHVIQSVPPSCINRDDTGSPKTAKYGGVTRARVSSQAWKHSMRDMFKDFFEPEQVGIRTKRIVARVEEEIIALEPSLAERNKEIEEKSERDKKNKNDTDGDNKKKKKKEKKMEEMTTDELAQFALKNAGLNIKSSEKGTDALFFLSRKQAKELAKLIVDKEKDSKKYAEALKSFPSIDMALFGRMVASDQSLNYDASAQVAHSISTHEVHNEFDYFTAVDDCKAEDSAGAGHVDTSEFNSSTLYRYATVNVDELYSYLKKDTAAAVRGFAEAFIRSMPTGKQNSFANRTLPELIYVTIRRDQPVNLVGAFEKPVRTVSGGYAERSIEQFSNFANKLYQMYDAQPEQAFVAGLFENNLNAEAVSFKTMLDELEKLVKESKGDE